MYFDSLGNCQQAREGILAGTMSLCPKTRASRPGRPNWATWAKIVVLVILWHGAVPVVRGQQPSAPKDPTASKQDEAKPEPQTEAEKASNKPAAEQGMPMVGPDTYILLDAEGHPQPVPGMTYEDFMAAWKRLNQLGTTDEQPSYAIEDMTFRGQVIGQRAELEGRIAVRLIRNGPIRVPLGLVGAIVQGEPKFSALPTSADAKLPSAEVSKNNGEPEFLTSDPEHGGYVAQVRGTAGERRLLTINILVPLAHDGPETSLPINCPHAVSSQLELDIDSQIGEARVNAGSLVTQEPNTKGGTRVKVAGLSGMFRLAWQNATKESSAMASVLSALGTIHVTLDGRGIRSDARLTVRSYGGAFDQFRVRLPVGSQLVQAKPDTSQSPHVQYRIRLENKPSAPAEKNADSRPIVVVELAEKQQGPVIVDLAIEHLGNPENRRQDIDVGGFEVLGAVRQFGDVALNIADDWQARWEMGAFVRQVDPNELDSALQSFNPTAAFQYDRQPWSLNVRLARRQLQVHVTPKFEMECLPDEARLTVKLNYQTFGARAFEYRVALNGWELTGDPVESASLVDTDRISVTSEGTLLLPLVQASARRAEVTFSLRRPLVREARQLQVPLPVPVAESIGTGELVVRAAPEVSLLPDLTKSTGLTPVTTIAGGENQTSDGATELRYRTLLPAAVFAADRTRRSRDIATQSLMQIEVGESDAKIERRFDYSVRFEPISELTFEVADDFPSDAVGVTARLATGNGADAKPNEQAIPLQASLIDAADAGSVDESSRLLRLTLPRPLMGKFSVSIRYRADLPSRGSRDLHWEVPTMRCTEGRLSSESSRIHWTDQLSVVLDEGAANQSWRLAASTKPHEEGLALDNAGEHLGSSLPLIIRSAAPQPPAATVVERAWLQTWLSKGIIQNRAAFRIRTAGSQATIELPPDTTGAETEILVNHEPARILSQAPGRVVIQLSGGGDAVAGDRTALRSIYTIELRTRQEYRPSLVTLHRLTPPQIEGSIVLSQVYWQFILPSDEHVISEPAQLTSASEWQWLGAFWGRQPLKSQGELEEWSGASQQVAPTASQNQYLFSGITPVSSIELTTAPRWLIVLVASACVLAVTIMYRCVPQARRMWLLAVLATVLVLAAITYPGVTLLLAQASVLGLLLAGVSLIISRVTANVPGYRAAPAVISPSSQRIVTPRSEPLLMTPLAGVASTAPTASLRVSES